MITSSGDPHWGMLDSCRNLSNATWVWSDTHFGHHNIIKFQQRPATHEIIMLSNWALLVPDTACILHLGDVHLRSNWSRWEPLLHRMPGRKLLVLGNHDHHGVQRYERAGFEVIDPFVWTRRDGLRVAFTHRPLTDEYRGAPEPRFNDGGEWIPHETWDVNVHGHIHLNAHRAGECTPYATKRYINVSVEALDLAPRQLGNLL